MDTRFETIFFPTKLAELNSMHIFVSHLTERIAFQFIPRNQILSHLQHRLICTHRCRENLMSREVVDKQIRKKSADDKII